MTKAPSMVALGEVADFIRGINFKPDDVVSLDTPGSVACMRTKNVQTEIHLSDVWAVGEVFVRREEQMLQCGDILVSSANSWNLVGKCCWIPQLPYRASFGGFISVLRGKKGKVFNRYLYHWFASGKIQALLRSFGQKTTNISNLNFDRCLKLLIPLPPLEEQKRIAEVLDKAEEVRAKRRAALAQLDTLTQSIFLEMFGDPSSILEKWPTKKLGELLEFLTSGSRGWAEYYSESGDLFLRIQNVRRDHLLLDDIAFVKAPDTAEAKRTRVQTGDVLLSITADLGRTAVVPEGLGTAYINQHLSILRSKALVPRFLSAYFASPAGERQVFGRNRHAVKAGLNFDDIRSFLIPVPPIELQRKFANRVTTVKKLKSTQRASLVELDTLFASLQHRAFSGKL
ncbi:MAG: restriction endonuclease subunit S [Verrucomicrobia bacterium]|nr:restriction endonuclease subunit S [Verrucomicrobiota bacterium]